MEPIEAKRPVDSPGFGLCSYRSGRLGSWSNESLGGAACSARSKSVQQDAFDELFRRLWRISVEWARAAGARVHGVAEDAATQAWAKAWRYRAGYDATKGCYGTWLGAIVRNETMDLLRTLGRESSAQDARGFAGLRDVSAPPEPELGSLSFVFEAFEELRRSKPDFARVLFLKSQGYKEKQICELMAISTTGTVASRLSRSKEFIARQLAEKGVVFLLDGAIGTVHPLGLVPLCRTGEGAFYGFSPVSGLFVLPGGMSPPPGATLVCEAFLAKLWAYSLDRFEVRADDERAVNKCEGAIFSWNRYSVVLREDPGTRESQAGRRPAGLMETS
ncbi:MAG: RNA polymerase sigma factor [Actinomycetota bacterium]